MDEKSKRSNWFNNKRKYCILNVHNDGDNESWLRKGMEIKDKYINLWTQIAIEFKDYNEYLKGWNI